MLSGFLAVHLLSHRQHNTCHDNQRRTDDVDHRCTASTGGRKDGTFLVEDLTSNFTVSNDFRNFILIILCL